MSSRLHNIRMQIFLLQQEEAVEIKRIYDECGHNARPVAELVYDGTLERFAIQCISKHDKLTCYRCTACRGHLHLEAPPVAKTKLPK